MKKSPLEIVGEQMDIINPLNWNKNMDNKYDQSFKKSELGEDDAMERTHNEEVRDIEEHITREPDNFGGGDRF